jgi:hypothetical protein
MNCRFKLINCAYSSLGGTNSALVFLVLFLFSLVGCSVSDESSDREARNEGTSHVFTVASNSQNRMAEFYLIVEQELVDLGFGLMESKSDASGLGEYRYQDGGGRLVVILWTSHGISVSAVLLESNSSVALDDFEFTEGLSNSLSNKYEKLLTQ